jgi:hypothetical protein
LDWAASVIGLMTAAHSFIIVAHEHGENDATQAGKDGLISSQKRG